MSGIDTFLLTPDEAETSCISPLQNGYRLIDTATDAFRAENCAVKAENPHSSISAPYPSYPRSEKAEAALQKQRRFG